MSILHRLLRPLARATGLSARLNDGRFIPQLSVCLPNFIAQRIFRINGSCKVAVHFTSRVMFPERITMGKYVAMSFSRSIGCYIQATNGIEFGDGVMFGPGVKIISANHDPGNLRHAWTPAEPIRIGNESWIGANAVLLPGVQLGERVIVGAGSIVTKSFPSDVVIAGNPARIIKESPHAFTLLLQRTSRPSRAVVSESGAAQSATAHEYE